MKKQAFTLFEVLLVMGLVSLLMTILLTTVVRLARAARITSQAALRRKHWLEGAERLRWQLRNLYQPAAAKAPENAANPGLVGTHESALWGEPGQEEGRDQLSFLTTRSDKDQGVCEVSYRLQARPGGSGLDLVWRQFPLRQRAGLHLTGEFPEAPWKVALDKATHLSLDYSEDGWVWRRDWTTNTSPRRIRIHLEAEALPALDFQVTPGVGAGRW